MAQFSEQEVLQAIQGLEAQVQALKQSVQTGGQISKDQNAGKATLGFEDVTHDTDTAEAHKASVLSQTRIWNWNDKALSEVELAHKQLALKIAEHNFAVQQQLDSLRVRSAEQAELVKNMLNVEYAKFNNAQSEPINPNTQG